MNYQKQKEAVLRLYEKTLALEELKSNSEVLDRLLTIKNKMMAEKIIMVVAGEFKRGKSSLINALLNEKGCDLFPVDTDIATNLVTAISYGKEEIINVVMDNGEKDEIQKITRDEIADYVTEQKNEGNYKRAKMLKIVSENKFLSDGMTIVDTPGVAINPEHTAITYELIPNADVVLYTTDIQAPLSETELDFIKSINNYCKNIIFVATKKDLVIGSSLIIEENRKKISQTLSQPEDSLQIIAVSSNNKLSYLNTGDDEDLEDSNFTALEAVIEDMVKTRRAEITLNPALDILGEVLINMKTPLVNQWRACQQENKEITEKKQKEFEQMVQKKQRLLEDNSDWLSALSNGIIRIKQDSATDISEGIDRIQKNIEEYLEIPKNLKSPQNAIDYVEGMYDSFMLKITTQNQDRINMLTEELIEMTSLTLGNDMIEPCGFSFDDENIKINVKPTKLFSKSITAVRMATFNGGAGASIGAVFGTAVGLVVSGGVLSPVFGQWGFVVGGIMGELLGVKEGLKTVNDRDRAAIRSKIIPVLNSSSNKCKNAITKQLTEMEISLRDELKAMIKSQKELYEGMISDIKATVNLTASQMEEKSKELETKIKSVNVILKEFEGVINLMKESKKTSTRDDTVKHAWAD